MRVQLKNKMADKLFLIVVAVVIVCLLLGGLILMEGHYALSKDWSLFFLFSLGYVVIVSQGCFSIIKKQKSKLTKIVQLIFIQLSVIALFYSMFFFRVISFPQRTIWPWGIGTIAIAFITIVAYTKFLHKDDLS